MANLKLDLLDKISKDKMFEELELVRLAQDPNMNYKDKIDLMQYQLERLSILNAELGLIEVYFKEPAPQAAPVTQGPPVNAPGGVVHPGQSHGE
jgi:hypothetical protein